MEKRVLIVGYSETFIVKGIEMKLSEIGVDSVFSETKIKSIKEAARDTDVIIFYMDEAIKDMTDVVVYLNDICTEEDKKLIPIGKKVEYEIVKKHVKPKSILKWFERPLDMNSFLDMVEAYFELASIEARKKSILIVDDDVTYMRMIAEWLEHEYRVGMANSGIQAITWLAKNHADLILLDYDMPVTPGPQVMEMLRTEAETSTIPIMFLTGKRDRNSIVNVLRLKPADYLVKTIDRNTLLKKLEKFFLSKRAES